MRKSRTTIGLTILVLILSPLLLFAACGGEDETTTTATSSQTTAVGGEFETLRIGAIFQLTDWYSSVDAGEIRDCEVVAKLINEKYPITIGETTYKIELVTQDGKSTLDGNTTAANKLVFDDQVKFAVGPSAFFNAATSPIFEQEKVMHVAGFNTFIPGEMDKTTPYGFLGSAGPAAMASAQIKALKREYPEVRNVQMASADEATATYAKDMWKKTVTDNGFNLVGDLILYGNSATDFNPIAVQLNASKEADAYWLALGTPPAYGNITKDLRALGNTKPIVFPNYAPSTLAIVGPEYSTDILNPLSFIDDDPGNPPLLQEVLDARTTDLQWFGMTPNALWCLAEAIKAAQSVEPADVVAAWESMDTMNTLYGDTILCGTQTFGLKNHAVVYPCSVHKIVEGQIQCMDWITPDPTP